SGCQHCTGCGARHDAIRHYQDSVLPVSRLHLGDAVQLINKPSLRAVLSYTYIVGLGVLTVVAIAVWQQRHADTPPDDAIEVLYLVCVLILLSTADVRIERGRINLSGIAIGASAILLNPSNAAVVGLAIAIPMARRGYWPILANAIMTSANACVGALIASELRSTTPLTLQSRVLVLAVVIVSSWAIVASCSTVAPWRASCTTCETTSQLRLGT